VRATPRRCCGIGTRYAGGYSIGPTLKRRSKTHTLASEKLNCIVAWSGAAFRHLACLCLHWLPSLRCFQAEMLFNVNGRLSNHIHLPHKRIWPPYRRVCTHFLAAPRQFFYFLPFSFFGCQRRSRVEVVRLNKARHRCVFNCDINDQVNAGESRGR
jgi:hypothetical protein